MTRKDRIIQAAVMITNKFGKAPLDDWFNWQRLFKKIAGGNILNYKHDTRQSKLINPDHDRGHFRYIRIIPNISYNKEFRSKKWYVRNKLADHMRVAQFLYLNLTEDLYDEVESLILKYI